MLPTIAPALPWHARSMTSAIRHPNDVSVLRDLTDRSAFPKERRLIASKSGLCSPFLGRIEWGATAMDETNLHALTRFPGRR
jgi:hypothetical protein